MIMKTFLSRGGLPHVASLYQLPGVYNVHNSQKQIIVFNKISLYSLGCMLNFTKQKADSIL